MLEQRETMLQHKVVAAVVRELQDPPAVQQELAALVFNHQFQAQQTH
jgi:hypothetical protein